MRRLAFSNPADETKSILFNPRAQTISNAFMDAGEKAIDPCKDAQPSHLGSEMSAACLTLPQ